jgi:hypothetical protein
VFWIVSFVLIPLVRAALKTPSRSAGNQLYRIRDRYAIRVDDQMIKQVVLDRYVKVGFRIPYCFIPIR